MRKTHTKNLLSMAPTLTMFTSKPSNNSHQTTNKQQKSAFNHINLPNQQLNQSASTKYPSSMKYNRSISSFRKNHKQSPDKKFSVLNSYAASGSKSRPTLPNNAMAQTNPFVRITQLFKYQISAGSQQCLYEDFCGKFENTLRILEESFQSQTIMKVFKQIKTYFTKIFSINLRFAQKRTAQYIEQVNLICSEYQQRIKQAQIKQRQKIRKHILAGQTQLGRRIQQLKNKCDFATKIFNQMQIYQIDLMGWIKQSEIMQNYVNSRTEQQVVQASIFISQQNMLKQEKQRPKMKKQKKHCNTESIDKQQTHDQPTVGFKNQLSNIPQIQIIEEQHEFENLGLQAQQKPLMRQHRTMNRKKLDSKLQKRRERLNKSN